VGQTEKTSAIVLLSAAVRADGILSANEQIINFFILHSADGSGRQALNFPPAQSPGRWQQPFMTLLTSNEIV